MIYDAPAVRVAEPIFGVDFGTTKLCAAALDPSGIPVTLADPQLRKVLPAVLSLRDDGTILIGDEAEPRRLEDPKNTIFGVARLLGQAASQREVLDFAARSAFEVRVGAGDEPAISTRAGDMAPIEIAALLFERLRRNAGLALNTDSRRAVLAAPACATPATRQALVGAARQAGFAVERVLDAPLAFATAWAYGRSVPGGVVAVYDFGGGKFECTIVELRAAREPQILGTQADTLLSGDELIARIVDYIIKAFWQVHRVDLRADAIAPLRLALAAEDAAKALAAAPETTLALPEIIRPPGAALPLDLHLELSRDTIAAAVADIVQRTSAACEGALRQAGVSAASVGEVLLCGGPTRLPFVREHVARVFGRPGRSEVNADEGVAVGAAIWGVHGGVPDSVSVASISKRVTAQFGSDAQQAVPATAIAASPASARVGRVHTKRMFTAVMQAVQTPPGGSPVAPIIFPGGLAPGQAGASGGASFPGAAPGGAPGVPGANLVPGGTALPPSGMPPTLDPTGASFSPPRMVKPIMLEVLAERLAVSTVGGFCDEIIAKDAPVPTERSRVFSTGKDGQRLVKVSVCQGASRRFDENLQLGTIVLDNLPPRSRGQVRIVVTFSVDADGVLRASARDEETGAIQSVEIHLKDGDDVRP
jgi:molecular chaperone DnaK